MAIKKLCAGAIGALAAGSLAAQAKPLIIAYPVWVGYGPLFVAQEKGFFDEDLDVRMIAVEDGDWEGLRDGQFDAISTTVDEVAAWFDPNQRPLCVLALDESRGGDGIVATKDIESIADLAGKTVALQDQSMTQFYLHTLLLEAGLTSADIQPVDLAPPDAAEAFLLREVDAVVLYEPWLTDTATAEHAHLLTDSSERPGLIVDCLVTTAAAFDERKSEFQALARGWAAAVDYYEAYPDEAVEIMARHLGDWLEDPATFAATLEGVRFYDKDRGEAYFGTPQSPGPIYDTAQRAIDVWSSLGVLVAVIAPADIIGHGVWDR